MKRLIRKSIKFIIPMLMIISQLLNANAFGQNDTITIERQKALINFIQNYHRNDLNKLYLYDYVLYKTPNNEYIFEYALKDNYYVNWNDDHYAVGKLNNGVTDYGWNNPTQIILNKDNSIHSDQLSFNVVTDLKPNNNENGNRLIYTSMTIIGGAFNNELFLWDLLYDNTYNFTDSNAIGVYNYLKNNNYLDTDFKYLITAFHTSPLNRIIGNRNIMAYNLIILPNTNDYQIKYIPSTQVYGLFYNNVEVSVYNKPNTIIDSLIFFNNNSTPQKTKYYDYVAYPNDTYVYAFATYFLPYNESVKYNQGYRNNEPAFFMYSNMKFTNGYLNNNVYKWTQLEELISNNGEIVLPPIIDVIVKPDVPTEDVIGGWFGWIFDNLKLFLTNSFNAIIQPLIDLKNWFFSTDIGEGKNAIGDFFSNFNANTFGLTSVITAPLITINSLANNQCVGIPMELIGYDFTLPCLDELLPNYFDDLIVLYRTITDGIIGYFIMINLLKLVKDFKDPEKDNIEVLDL